MSQRAVEVPGFAFYRHHRDDTYIIWALIGDAWMPYASTDKGEGDAKRLARKTSNKLRRTFERCVGK